MEQFKRTWAEIDLSAIGKNYHTVRRQVGGDVQIMAVVKADAYGHGAAEVASYLQEQGADQFGVAALQEAIELRKCGIDKPILILGYTDPEYFHYLPEYDLCQTVFDMESARRLSAVCVSLGVIGKVHAALDTGMGRLGFDAFDAEGAAAAVKALAELPGIQLEGMFTHFSVADTEGEEAYTEAQFERFEAVRRRLKEQGICPLCHIANSAGTFAERRYHLDMVRAGIVLYGLEPGGRENPFCPAMTMKTKIAFLKDLPAGRSVSYGRRYQTEGVRKVATLCAGYADGYPRCLSGRGEVLINGRRAPILGAVCMDMMMVDVTDLPCKAGEEAILMGGGIDVGRLAEQAGTIHYELLCGLSKRVPRVYRKR